MSIDLTTAVRALQQFVAASFEKMLDTNRLCRSATALFLTGNGREDTKLSDFAHYVLGRQSDDGGWADPEETAWAVAVLSQPAAEHGNAVTKAKEWLHSARHADGGWGRHPRDQMRIPTTALVLTLVPSVATDADKAWVRQGWEKDLNSPVHLSYKGGFYLLTVDKEGKEEVDPLTLRTIAYLAEDQNDDGGFGPWRNHPIGSDPWSTGVVLWGLSKWIDYVDREVVEKALGWLERTQLPSGYWPYHFLDEGTSYALIGAVSALRAMENRK